MTVIIGIDPHKASHMAVAIDGDEHAIARLDQVDVGSALSPEELSQTILREIDSLLAGT